MDPEGPPRANEPATIDEAAEARLQKAKKEVEAEWDRRLACLNHPDTPAKIEAIFRTGGRVKKRSIAGATF
jgi:hypothetical protein